MSSRIFTWCVLLVSTAALSAAEDRLQKVLGDKPKVESAGKWIYNDLAAGLEQGRQTGKPLLVVLRCVP